MPPRHSVRRTSTSSSSRLPRLSKSWPMASNSSRIHPAASPRLTLSPDTTAAVATALATTRWLRAGAT